MSARTVSLVALLAAPLLTGCVTTPGGVSEAELDRFEKTNRAIYSFNKGVDTAVLKPVTQGYRAVVPGIARRGVSNALVNVDEPLSFINAVLQGKFKVAFRAADRFLINSTMRCKEKTTWDDGKEYPLLKVEISSASHPFYTGKMKFIDSAGRVEKFNKKYKWLKKDEAAAE